MMARALPVLGAEPAPPAVDAHADLVAGGWTRRFMAAGSRAAESALLYESLGFEVHLEPPGLEDLREECGDCRLALATFRVLYTRRRT
jgi:hypothetical protein